MGIIITAGCVGGNQNSVITPTPQIVYVTVSVTPTQQTNIQLENDKVFSSRIVTFNNDIEYETNQMYIATQSFAYQSATRTESLKIWAYWSNKLKSTCSDAKTELHAIRVSPEFQPVKDEYLAFLSDYEKTADSDITAIDYISNGQDSLAVSYMETGQSYADSANAKLSTTNQLIRIYRDKLGI